MVVAAIYRFRPSTIGDWQNIDVHVRMKQLIGKSKYCFPTTPMMIAPRLIARTSPKPRTLRMYI
jgi:hypothetical protein